MPTATDFLAASIVGAGLGVVLLVGRLVFALIAGVARRSPRIRRRCGLSAPGEMSEEAAGESERENAEREDSPPDPRIC
jgi:hypothetical protein